LEASQASGAPTREDLVRGGWRKKWLMLFLCVFFARFGLNLYPLSGIDFPGESSSSLPSSLLSTGPVHEAAHGLGAPIRLGDSTGALAGGRVSVQPALVHIDPIGHAPVSRCWRSFANVPLIRVGKSRCR